MPLDVLQRVLGHRHIDIVMIYNEVRQSRVYREYQEAMAIQNAARRLRGQVDGGRRGHATQHACEGRRLSICAGIRSQLRL